MYWQAVSLLRSSGVLALVTLGLVVAYGCGSSEGEAVFPPGSGDDGGPGNTSGDFGPGSEGGLGGDSALKPLCGNSVKDPGETCDDANGVAGDGCSATCQIEPGYKCGTIGAACAAAACGDGVVAGDEDCDDGNMVASDGCSATCVFEPGFFCPTPGKPCVATTCGDTKKQGSEQCDDGNLRPYDGCSPTCTVEPKCAAGACTAVCGDGVKVPGEACDDGNVRSGDGCSATCQIEPGFMCTVVTADLPATLDVPIIYRDFNGPGSMDFENDAFNNGRKAGLVKPTLAADNEPELLSVGSPQCISSAASFATWYHDGLTNRVVLDKLTFTKQAGGEYLYNNGAFFPVDGKGFGNEGRSNNFHFTSELRYYFTFKGGEVLEFAGDDDVWVFVNGKLAVDIGGVHGVEAGSVTLSGATATSLGLVAGGMYELDLFQAERHTTASNYKLTLRGFEKAKTSCAPICGDGIKTKDEACDDGANTGGYGKCAAGCVLGPRCGDGVVQADQGEQCDDANLVSQDGCSATCKTDVSVPK